MMLSEASASRQAIKIKQATNHFTITKNNKGTATTKQKQANNITRDKQTKQANNCAMKRIARNFFRLNLKFFTSVPLQVNPSLGLRSSGCRMRSESLNWHKTRSFIVGPMLIDIQWRSIVHRPMQELRIPTLKEIFLIT